MTLFSKLRTTIKEARAIEDMKSQVDRQQAQLEYVAAMTDVELPINDAEEDCLNE